MKTLTLAQRWITASLIFSQLSCSSPAVPKAYVTAAKDDKISSDAGLETIDPKVDILFVIDNSGSMSSHQRNMALNMDRFVANFFSQMQVNFQIGVITTDNNSYQGGDCCGRLVGIPNFVDKSTPNYQSVLLERMVVGTNGSATEMAFDPLHAAFSEPNLSNSNKGFLRPDAYLAVIIITDAEDQSKRMGPDQTFAFLANLKGMQEKVLTYGVIVPSGVRYCERDDGTEPSRIEKFLSLSVAAGNNSFSLCASDFGDRLADLGKDLAKRVANTFFLNRIPIPETIEVTFGNQTIPADPIKGWTFDPARNAIVFGSEIDWSSQPAGTKVSVKYDFTQFQDGPKN